MAYRSMRWGAGTFDKSAGVYDEQSLVDLVRSYLEAEGYVFEALDGHSAFKLAEREAPDAMVFDLMMHGLDSGGALHKFLADWLRYQGGYTDPGSSSASLLE
ncbi:MAG: hypothetical protein ABI670_17195 [Chloroflexota bacterium]